MQISIPQKKIETNNFTDKTRINTYIYKSGELQGVIRLGSAFILTIKSLFEK